MGRFRFSDGIEVKCQINQYKRGDVFVCRQEGHGAFNYRVSVYHVLKEKQCYPYGCISFSWRCNRFTKGLSCPRGYHRVGRMCFGCRFFIDEKINHRPQVLLSPEDFRVFQGQLQEFENWVEGLRGREVNFSGTVFSVKPNVILDPSRHRRITFHGFLVVFREGFVDLIHLKDFCYLRVSGRVQEKYRFRPGDRLDFFARFAEDRGRIILVGVNRVEIDDRAEGFWWNGSRARVALQTGRMVDGQPERCLACKNGCLVDAKPSRQMVPAVRRRLFCLAGVRNPKECPYLGLSEEVKDECGISKAQSLGRDRLTTLSNVAVSHGM